MIAPLLKKLPVVGMFQVPAPKSALNVCVIRSIVRSGTDVRTDDLASQEINCKKVIEMELSSKRGDDVECELRGWRKLSLMDFEESLYWM